MGHYPLIVNSHDSQNLICRYVYKNRLYTKIECIQKSNNDNTTIKIKRFEIAGLTELWLCNNVIYSIPAEISDLKQLTTLSLKGNLLQSIPLEIGLLHKLKRLLLGGNRLTDLPDSLRQLTVLSELDLSCNMFDSVPCVVCDLKGITRLNLAGNNFKYLSSQLGRLKSLTTLDLSHSVVREHSSVLQSMSWVAIIGYDTIPDSSAVSASLNWNATHDTSFVLFSTAAAFPLHPDGEDEREIDGFLRARAAARSAIKLRRRRKDKKTIPGS